MYTSRYKLNNRSNCLVKLNERHCLILNGHSGEKQITVMETPNTFLTENEAFCVLSPQPRVAS